METRQRGGIFHSSPYFFPFPFLLSTFIDSPFFQPWAPFSPFRSMWSRTRSHSTGALLTTSLVGVEQLHFRNMARRPPFCQFIPTIHLPQSCSSNTLAFTCSPSHPTFISTIAPSIERIIMVKTWSTIFEMSPFQEQGSRSVGWRALDGWPCHI